jgi:hypothetical protein
MQLSACGFQELFSSIVQLTLLLNLVNRSEISVDPQMRRSGRAFVLDGMGGLHPLANRGRTFFWDVAQDLFSEQPNTHLKSKTGAKHLFALPAPVGPTSRMGCSPAAATSRALLT